MDKQRNRVNRGKPKEKADYFLTTTLVQIVICAVVFLLLFLLTRGSGDGAQQIKNDYQLLFSRDLSAEDVSDAWAAVKEFFTPVDPTAAVLAPAGGPAQSTDAPPVTESAEPATEPDTTQQPETQQSPAEQAVAAETAPLPKDEPTTVSISKKAAKKEANDGKGGNDVKTLAAEKNTSFSPTAVTAPITRPVDGGRYSSLFGYRNNPITHQYAFHTGLDIAVPQGTLIRAAYSGQVRLVGTDERAGNYVTLSHAEGYETFYCHCSRILVKEGTVVRAGEAIAKVGSTGWATGPHLHFEVRKNGEKLDPLLILEHDV